MNNLKPNKVEDVSSVSPYQSLTEVQDLRVGKFPWVLSVVFIIDREHPYVYMSFIEFHMVKTGTRGWCTKVHEEESSERRH